MGIVGDKMASYFEDPPDETLRIILCDGETVAIESDAATTDAEQAMQQQPQHMRGEGGGGGVGSGGAGSISEEEMLQAQFFLGESTEEDSRTYSEVDEEDSDIKGGEIYE